VRDAAVNERRDAAVSERLARPLLSRSNDADVRDASRCAMDVGRLCWLEDEIRCGRAPPQARKLLRQELGGYFDAEQANWASLRPSLCIVMYELPRDGRDTLEKNASYTIGCHRLMSQDLVRTQAYSRAIRRALAGRSTGARVLDVGSGPFMLLGRMALAEGASFVACIEHSEESVDLASEILRCEAAQFAAQPDWRKKMEERTVDEPDEARCGERSKKRSKAWREERSGERSGSCSMRSQQLGVRRHREVDGCMQMIQHLSLELQPMRLNFCATGDAVAPNGQASLPAAACFTGPQLRATATSRREQGAGGNEQPAAVIELYKGLSSSIALPPGIDLILHEILGNVASAEGAIHAINELCGRTGLTSRGCRVIPCAAGTLLTPTCVLEPSVVERLLMYHKTGGFHAAPRRLYAVRGMPSAHWLSAPQPMEWLDFNKPLELASTRKCCFRTAVAGVFDGVHMHLVVDLDESTTIDAYRERTTWTCTYVRLLDAGHGIWLPAGAMIECTCHVDASTHCPEYSIAVRVSRDGTEQSLVHVTEFSWRGDG